MTKSVLSLADSLKLVEDATKNKILFPRLEELLRRYDDMFRDLIEENRQLRMQLALKLAAAESAPALIAAIKPDIGQRVVTCTVCNHPFTCSSNGPPPKRCGGCQKQFKRQYARDYHLKRKEQLPQV